MVFYWMVYSQIDLFWGIAEVRNIYSEHVVHKGIYKSDYYKAMSITKIFE